MLLNSKFKKLSLFQIKFILNFKKTYKKRKLNLKKIVSILSLNIIKFKKLSLFQIKFIINFKKNL